MRNIVIAIGGSGTKVANALVRLLALGFPTRWDKYPTSSGEDELQIWQVDPDRGSGALEDLTLCLTQYQELQRFMNNDQSESDGAGSPWSMKIESRVRQFDPLDLPDQTTPVRNLRQLLNSQNQLLQSSEKFLKAFYTEKDLEVEIDRGFYQKPFIGSSVMAVFAKSLETDHSSAGRMADLKSLKSREVRFFIVGSLFGGTGACGVPVLGQFLSKFRGKDDSINWRIGGCLLSPYVLPPPPPFPPLSPELRDDKKAVEAAVAENLPRLIGDARFGGVSRESRETIVRQIVQGFFADPADLLIRSRHSLAYYSDLLAFFDELSLVGKIEPDQLTDWCNGGPNQRNPLNSAEITAALAALRFFSGSADERQESGKRHFRVANCPGVNSTSQGMTLSMLPGYATSPTGKPVNPEAVLLATALTTHFIRHQIPWEIPLNDWPNDFDWIHRYYTIQGQQKRQIDAAHYREIARRLGWFFYTTTGAEVTQGWHPGVWNQLEGIISDDPSVVRQVKERTKKAGFLGWQNKPKEPIFLGNIGVEVGSFEFAKWQMADQEFRRGDYFGMVRSRILERIQAKESFSRR